MPPSASTSIRSGTSFSTSSGTSSGMTKSSATTSRTTKSSVTATASSGTANSTATNILMESAQDVYKDPPADHEVELIDEHTEDDHHLIASAMLASNAIGATSQTTNITPSGTSHRALISHAKQMAEQLQALVEGRAGSVSDLGTTSALPLASHSLISTSTGAVAQSHSRRPHDSEMILHSANGQAPAYDELVQRLESVLHHQREVNEATARMSSASYLVSMVNYARNRSLQRLVTEGRHQLVAVRAHVAELEHQVDTLCTDVAVQQKIADRLRSSLDATRSLLDSAVVEYRAEMARQRASLAQHQVTIDKLFRARFHQDLLVDGTAFLVAWWVARSALVRYPISGASRVMGWLPLWAVWRTSAAATGVVVDHSALALRQRQATRFTRALLQLMAIVYVTRELRKMASGYGVHARVGSVFGYVRWLVHGKGDDGTSASEEPQAKRQVGEAAVDVPPISTAATAITLL